MNFGTDTDQIKELARELKEYSGQVETIIANIYSKLEGLNGNGWQGKGYDALLISRFIVRFFITPSYSRL